ncbi:hypothetical protein B0T26DRAFT_805687 [Lasiosphaeria miniovina]|uniref:Monooxygenase n=1 Tax=Lasiosphaeria miniovina TaxID=1954250 RepID=A0AA40A6E9_9PEZI|nr:uncharacterized protein B0T26DRAFT_805687 [Lasiosphaeria miniovina]KAK0710177.1 hypothetical protein B0T26DRAFT_805687 [Lasiosphaeria miniovina]
MERTPFQGIFPPQSDPPPSVLEHRRTKQSFIKDGFKLRTLLVIGALCQLALVAVLPLCIAMLPALVLAFHAAFETLLQCLTRGGSNPLMKGVVVGRTTAQFPSIYTGNFSHTPSEQRVVVFHLGVAFNHPLSVACPGGREVGGLFAAMEEELTRRAGEYGVLGVSQWVETARDTHNAMLVVVYFRSLDGLQRFARGDAHRAGWVFLDAFRAAGNHHIATFHETFEAQPGHWETLYTDSKPAMLGNARFKALGAGEGKEGAGNWVWVRGLVSASDARLRSMMDRMGRTRARPGM